MSKFDYKKALKDLYFPSVNKLVFVDIPPLNYLMIDGHGDPNTSSEYQEICNALYSMAYTAKFALKKSGFDFVVPPLEGLWWMENMAEFSPETKDRWDWTMMIMMPETVTRELVESARSDLAEKKPLTFLSSLRFQTYHEGLCVQTMYIGAYSDEGPTIANMHVFIAEQGYEPNGKHHEIYLGDPRRNPPEKLKTVIRQPVRKIN